MKFTINNKDISADISLNEEHWLISIVNTKTGKIIETKELTTFKECLSWLKEKLQYVEGELNKGNRTLTN